MTTMINQPKKLPVFYYIWTKYKYILTTIKNIRPQTHEHVGFHPYLNLVGQQYIKRTSTPQEVKRNEKNNH